MAVRVNLLVLVPLIIVVCAISLGVPFAIFESRKKYLRRLGPSALPALQRMTASLLEGPTTTSAGHGSAAVVGTLGGEALEVRATFSPSASPLYVRSGFKSGIGAELSVTVGLRGATPRFSCTAKGAARAIADAMDSSGPPGAKELAKAWEIDVDDDLARDVVDDELRADLMAFVLVARDVRSIAIGPRGLTITWLGDGGVGARAAESAESERIRAASALAVKLQRRILESIERRAQPHLRIGAYRDGGAPDAQAEAEAAEIEDELSRSDGTDAKKGT